MSSKPAAPRPEDWPDEEDEGVQANAGIRTDTGVSQGTSKSAMEGPPDADEPRGEKGPAGSGQSHGYGHLGTTTPGEAGAPEEKVRGG